MLEISCCKVSLSTASTVDAGESASVGVGVVGDCTVGRDPMDNGVAMIGSEKAEVAVCTETQEYKTGGYRNGFGYLSLLVQ